MSNNLWQYKDVIVREFKSYGKASQFSAVGEALQTVQFIRNKALRLWMDTPSVSKYDLAFLPA
jgi:putative transposase